MIPVRPDAQGSKSFSPRHRATGAAGERTFRCGRPGSLARERPRPEGFLKNFAQKKSRADSCSRDFSAAKLPNSDLNFAVAFRVDCSSVFSKEKGPQKIHPKIHGKIHPGIRSDKFPSDFCRSLLLRKVCVHFRAPRKTLCKKTLG